MGINVDEIRKRVAEIAKIGERDDESAHVEEARLYEDVLDAIANGACDDPAACSAEALKTRDLDFSRWYA